MNKITISYPPSLIGGATAVSIHVRYQATADGRPLDAPRATVRLINSVGILLAQGLADRSGVIQFSNMSPGTSFYVQAIYLYKVGRTISLRDSAGRNLVESFSNISIGFYGKCGVLILGYAPKA